MRNKHTIKGKIEITCPFNDCGKTFDKTVTVDYITNQRGDVIEERIR